MTKVEFLRLLLWLAFIGDVAFLVGNAVLPPRDWYRHQMGWHLMSWALAFGIITGTTVLRSVIGPIPFWASALELAAVAGVIWWRTVWALYLKIKALARGRVSDEGGRHVNHDRLHR